MPFVLAVRDAHFLHFRQSSLMRETWTFKIHFLNVGTIQCPVFYLWHYQERLS